MTQDAPKLGATALTLLKRLRADMAEFRDAFESLIEKMVEVETTQTVGTDETKFEELREELQDVQGEIAETHANVSAMIEAYEEHFKS